MARHGATPSRDNGRGVRADGDKIRAQCKKCGLTQERLAEAAGLSARTIWSAVNSRRISLDSLRRLAEYFDLDDAKELIHPEPRRSEVWVGTLPAALPSELFVGREAQLKMLDEAWAADACRVVTVVGGWGTGKSTLITQWLKRLEKAGYGGAEWVLGWSFRGQGSEELGGGDAFFRGVLNCLDLPILNVGSEEWKAIQLTQLLRKHRTLLVLDGLEPIQTPPTTRDEGGKISNPAVRDLIFNLAHHINGLCVITSRFPVWDLADQESEGRRGRVWVINLPALGLGPAKKLLKSRNLHGPEEEFNKAVRVYQGNPLSLSLLASLLRCGYNGNIARWSDVSGDGTIDDILRSLERHLTSQGRAVMRLTGLFGGPAGAEPIRALRARPPIPGLSDALIDLDADQWESVLDNLRRFQLLTEPNKDRPGDLDCHPMIRGYYAKRLQQDQPQAWQEGHLRLCQHFKKEENLGVIDNLLLAIHHGYQAGRNAEVFDDLAQRKCVNFVGLTWEAFWKKRGYLSAERTRRQPQGSC
jgi:transcriptional regulator with XRE-family HTH domain